MIEQKLLSYFDGTLDQEEQTDINQWILSSDENARTANEIYHIFLASSCNNERLNIDSKSALEKINKQITRNKMLHFILIFQKVAAVLLLPLIATILYITLTQKSIEIITINSTPGIVAYFELPDGTKVSLNSGSTLNYPEKFDGDMRNVTLIGEAYFDVKKDRKRFVVNTLHNIQVEALGTEFNIEAYEKDEFVAVTLASGIIEVDCKNSTEKHTRRKIKEVGEKLIYNTITQSMVVNSGTLLTDISWKDGKITLSNTKLEDMVALLTKRFDVEFIIMNNALKEERFTGTFDSQFLPQILEYLRLSSGINHNVIEDKNTKNEIQKKIRIELY